MQSFVRKILTEDGQGHDSEEKSPSVYKRNALHLFDLHLQGNDVSDKADGRSQRDLGDGDFLTEASNDKGREKPEQKTREGKHAVDS